MASERRAYPRYPVRCPITLTLPDDASAVYEVQSNSLSRTSIQLECRQDLITALLRQQGLPYMCHLQFALPGHAHVHDLDASVVTQRRLSRQEYVLVLLLRHGDAGQEELLERQLAGLGTTKGPGTA
jgi:hypothetical protein